MITDELMDFYELHCTSVLAETNREFERIADRIDAEHEAMLADARKTVYQGYVELPKDADGVSIHVGDTVCRTDPPKVPSTVAYMTLFEDGDWQVHMDERANVHAAYQPSLLCHYHKPTVEELLEEMYDALDDARIPNGSEKRTYEEIIAEYAKKLQLREETE